MGEVRKCKSCKNWKGEVRKYNSCIGRKGEVRKYKSCKDCNDGSNEE